MMFQVKIAQRDPGVYTVAVYGALDAETHEKFIRDLNPLFMKTFKVVILDLGGVNYVSSLGIGAVFKVTQMAKARGATAVLTNLQPKIQKVFDIVKALPGAIFKNIAEADEYIDSLQKTPPAR